MEAVYILLSWWTVVLFFIFVLGFIVLCRFCGRKITDFLIRAEKTHLDRLYRIRDELDDILIYTQSLEDPEDELALARIQVEQGLSVLCHRLQTEHCKY